MELMGKFHIEKVTLPSGLKMRMAPSGFRQHEFRGPAMEHQGAYPKDPLSNPMTEDEVLFWSAGGSEFKDTHGNEVPVPLTGEGDHE